MNEDDTRQTGALVDGIANDPLMAQLKTIYDDVAKEPLPTELLSLLEKLDEVERSR